MISLLCPSRKRPKELRRFVDSVYSTADNLPEIVCYVDQDDDSYDFFGWGVKFVRGPRIVLSDTWNKCAVKASSEILMMTADDCVFKTPGWDAMIEKAFENCSDKILMVHGDDGVNGDRFGVFPTIHRRWVDNVGYFCPPCFVGDYPDCWLVDVANALGRRKFLPYVTEHLHWVHGKAPMDDTYRERLAKEKLNDPTRLYESMKADRDRDIALLRAVIG
jgi:hypothetical protein